MSVFTDFDDSVFAALGGVARKKGVVSRVAKVSASVPKSSLNLDILVQKMQGVFVSPVEGGFRVRLPRVRVASLGGRDLGESIRRLVKANNPGIDLEFSEDLADYAGEPDLIRKSVNPLWLLKRVNGDTYLIKRVC